MVQQPRHRSLQETPQSTEPLPESLEPAIAPRSTCPREARTRSSRSLALSPFRSNSCRSRQKDSVAKSNTPRLEVHEGARQGPIGRHKRTLGRRIRTPSSASAGHAHRGASMPTVIGHHNVKDQKHWLASPKREEVFGPLGITNIRTFIDPQNATRVAVLMDVPDMDALDAAMQNPEMAEAMAYDGVVAETLVILVEA